MEVGGLCAGWRCRDVFALCRQNSGVMYMGADRLGRGRRWRELPWQRCRAHSCGRAAALIPRPLAIRERSSSLEVLPSQRQLPPDNDGLATLCLPVLPARASSPRPGPHQPGNSAPSVGLCPVRVGRGVGCPPEPAGGGAPVVLFQGSRL